jgi:hypothetical protein
MRRILVLSLLLAVGVALLPGCSGGKDTGAPAAQSKRGRPPQADMKP